MNFQKWELFSGSPGIVSAWKCREKVKETDISISPEASWLGGRGHVPPGVGYSECRNLSEIYYGLAFGTN